MKITTAAEMREIDRVTSERFGVHSLGLMENAGTAVANFVRDYYPKANRITVICGKGNNGGDGFVAARKLHQAGKVVEVLLLADSGELKGDAANMFGRLPLKPVFIRTEQELKAEMSRGLGNADVVVDAVLGTGFKPPAQGLYAAAINAINNVKAPVVAVDIPSGADADAFALLPQGAFARADAVVTFTAPRPSHVFGGLTRGPIIVAPIGSPDEAISSKLELEVITARDAAPLLALRPLDANKGRFGHSLVIGGSLGKAGAAALAGMGALRSGAGLVTVATARSVLPTVAGFAPELMTEPLAETESGTISKKALEFERLKTIADNKSVVAIGPGLTRHSDTVQFVRAAVASCRLAVVLDADGLNAFENAVKELDGSARPLVLTPHPGEMARLTGLHVADIQKDRIEISRKFARERKALLVLKGHRTVFAAASGPVWINPTGNPGMATGGTGDVLTGMIAGFIAQNLSDISAATRTAIYLHGLAGDIARERMGEHSLVATDILAALPEAIHRAREWAEQKTVRI